MSSPNAKLQRILQALLRTAPPAADAADAITNVAGVALPRFHESELQPHKVAMTTVQHGDGRT